MKAAVIEGGLKELGTPGQACVHVQRRTHTACSQFHEVSKTVKLIEAESRILVAKGWREGSMGTYRLNGTNFQLCKISKI